MGCRLRGLVVLAVLAPNPIFVLILVLGGSRHTGAGGARHGAVGSYYRVPPLDRALIAGVYIGLIALLVLGMQATDLPRTIV